ncbi:MAG: cupin domain-containing protein [Bacteroidales bacterium]|nr:cupin domain-containing protein [Bacteroidales bacterium]MCF8387580.1 cupin domain-containing protein [Bacteroidales bacterium]MCF8397030.1 cupin domain-containing protein [Bacteroidales bacterium]
MKYSAQHWIDKLEMQKHPEGGYFKEVYRSEETIDRLSLNERYGGDRNYATAIYFLIAGEDFSGFHKLNSDEIWHFYEGKSLIIHMISQDGKLTQKKLGHDWESGEQPMVVIPRHSWFAGEMIDKKAYTLFGCTVAPGFDFKDFILADKAKLSQQFPQHEKLIGRLVHDHVK